MTRWVIFLVQHNNIELYTYFKNMLFVIPSEAMVHCVVECIYADIHIVKFFRYTQVAMLLRYDIVFNANITSVG